MGDPDGEGLPGCRVNVDVCLAIPELATLLCKQLEAASATIMFDNVCLPHFLLSQQPSWDLL